MPSVKFINHDGVEQVVEVSAGTSVMQAAVDNGIDGILAECGGACSCATCHCYVDDAWLDKAGTPESAETQMLDFVMNPQPNSRLSCQVVVQENMDGLVIRLPESQL